jgi:RimJ/RimL family protein N-acetyltransferase
MDGDVRLVPWGEDDFWLLRRTNSPEMTAHLGGPESEEKLADRHRRYVGLSVGRMYRVVLAEGEETAGSIGFWEREWRGGTVWETGWAVLPEFQGRGLAARAAQMAARLSQTDALRVQQGVRAGRVHPARSRRLRIPEGALDHVPRLAVRAER